MPSSAHGAIVRERFGVDFLPTLVSGVHPEQPITFSHLRSPSRFSTLSVPSESAVAVHILLTPLSDFTLWSRGVERSARALEPGDIILFDLETDPIAELRQSVETLRLYLSRGALREAADEAGVKTSYDFELNPGPTRDPVLENLARCLMPALANPDQSNGLFLDHIALAFRAHMIHQFAGEAEPFEARGGLVGWQLRRVRDLVEDDLRAEMSMTDLARECGLSVSHFARAFRQTVGMPPHRWLLQRRVERAKQLLQAGGLSLREVGAACGFSDQSHFTRVFTRAIGASPGAWRRSISARRPPFSYTVFRPQDA